MKFSEQLKPRGLGSIPSDYFSCYSDHLISLNVWPLDCRLLSAGTWLCDILCFV